MMAGWRWPEWADRVVGLVLLVVAVGALLQSCSASRRGGHDVACLDSLVRARAESTSRDDDQVAFAAYEQCRGAAR